MVSLGPIKDKEKINLLFQKNSLKYNDEGGCVEAVCNGETLGYSLYYLNNREMVLLYIEPINDLPFADGIIRSTLHIAAEKSIMKILYTSEFEDIYNKLGFIKSKEEKTLNIDLLFGGCSNCHK